MDIPASPLNATLQITFNTAAEITTHISSFKFYFHAAIIRVIKNSGTDKLIIILGADHTPFKYSISYARNDNTSGLLSAGAGNQNMLVKSANIDANMPVKLFLKANITIGIIKSGLIYQLKTLWCLSNAQLKNISFVRKTVINITVATANNIPKTKSIFLLITNSLL